MRSMRSWNEDLRRLRGCRTVLQHLKSPQAGLAEICRVTKVGGRVVVSDTDWDSYILSATDRAITRRVVHFFTDQIQNGWIGRQLPGLFAQAGLEDIHVEQRAFLRRRLGDVWNWWLGNHLRAACEAGVLSWAEAEGWRADLEDHDRRGAFLSCVSAFWVWGT